MGENFFWTSHDFLKRILHDSKKDSQISIRKSIIENANGKGDSYTSRLFRITIKSDNPVEKNTFFVKVLPDEGILRDLIVQSSSFSNEIKIYRETLPQMNKVLAHGAPQKFRNLGPECYYISSAEEPLVIIMEDMREKGYLMANRRKGLNLEHCLLVMKTIARFHASSIAAHADNASSIENYTTNLFFEESSEHFWKKYFKTTMITVAEVVRKWENFGDRFAEKLRARAESFRDDFVSVMSAKDDTFKVLVHGDLWVNNVLFHYDENNGKPDDAMLIDFQFCFFTSPGVDLQNFLHSSPTEHVPINHSDELLREYHKELCETLQLLGLGHRTIEFHHLLEEYEKKSLCGAFAALYCLPVILSEPSDAFDFESALRDQMDEDAVVRRTINEEYAGVLKRLLLEFEKKGVI
ncbi:hypothetical protein PR048_000847 [Dryococelus australis]|uniref:CHK kinase-like domain-containing protein n=1 Tax=Dryococelus australis TaxID=614101 RepID=A0ABQ9IFS2_9NEOP|nr:hypothetical protein PR048_000847 [Dryococelus australis]